MSKLMVSGIHHSRSLKVGASPSRSRRSLGAGLRETGRAKAAAMRGSRIAVSVAMRLATVMRLAMVIAAVVPIAARAQQACEPAAVPCCDFPSVTAPTVAAPPAMGYQIWPLSLTVRPDAVDRLLTLKPRFLRFNLGPNWRRRPPLNPEISDADLDAYITSGFASAQSEKAVYPLLRDIHAKSGATLMQIVWEPPPMPGEPDFSDARAPTWRSLKPQNVHLMARFLVAQLRYVIAAGVPLDAVELTNEPDGSWNLMVKPADYLELVRQVRAEAKRRNVALPAIYGPGTGRITTLVSYLSDAATAEGILAAVDVLSVHAWDDATGLDRIGPLDQLYAVLARLKTRRVLALTEFGVGRPVLSDGSDRMNARRRTDDSVALTPAYAAATIRELNRLFGHGVGPVVYWEFQDQPWGKSLLGLLDTQSREKPVYLAMKSFVAALDAGKPATMTSAVDGRVAVMHGRSGQDLVVAANAGTTPLDLILRSRSVATAKATGTAAVDACRSNDRNGLRIPGGGVAIAPLAGR